MKEELVMSVYPIDVDEKGCIVSFFIPRDIDPDSLKFLKGRVLVSAQNDVCPGDGVAVAGEGIRSVLENQGVVWAEMTANVRRTSDNDPKWFAKNLSSVHVVREAAPQEIQPREPSSASTMLMLQAIQMQLDNVIRQLSEQL